MASNYGELMGKLESLLVEAQAMAVEARRASEPMSHDRRTLMWITSELDNMVDAVVDCDGDN